MDDIQIIPAPAGYYGLWPISDAPGYGRAIITGWQIDAALGHVSWTHPLIEGENATGVEAILCPDGTVNLSDGGKFWPDVNAWLTEIRKDCELAA